MAATPTVTDPEDLPAAPGAYALAIEVPAPLRLGPAGGGVWDLAGGWYVYAGSARGPGGIRARVRRHLKAAKAPRWHVDRLTNAGGVAMVLALPGGRECAVVEGLLDRVGATVPVPGFGSSDCRACRAHLLALPGKPDLDGVTDLLDRAGLSGDGTAVRWTRPSRHP